MRTGTVNKHDFPDSKIALPYCNERLWYCADTGKLFWLKSPTNSVPVGTEAGTVSTNRKSKKKYRLVRIFGRQRPVHHVVWLICKGEWPLCELDHINGDSLDNHIDNLRKATRTQNNRNLCRSVKNTSGQTGVSWMKTLNKWRAFITVERKHVHIGVFTNLEDAIAARLNAEAEHGYHSEHGSIKGLAKTRSEV